MSIVYPLIMPIEFVRRVVIRARSVVGVSSSPFTLSQQVFVHPGQMWEADLELVPMQRADGEALVAFLLALNGRQGTFLLGDPRNVRPRGVATGTPLVAGAAQVGNTLAVDGFTPNVTGILCAGDWLQLGSGGSAHLHKVIKDANSDGSGAVTLDIWPRLRSSPADNDVVTLSAAKGLWRLASNVSEWSLESAQRYGAAVSCVEAL